VQKKIGCTICSVFNIGSQGVTPKSRKFECGDLVLASSIFKFREYWAEIIRVGYMSESTSKGDKGI